MEEEIFITNNAEETQKIAAKFTKNLKIGDRILLQGELGAGKTTFTAEAAKNLGVSVRVISPTFTLVRSYKGNLNNTSINVYHVDLYRVSDSREIDDLGLSEIFEDKTGIVFVEWGKRYGKLKYNWEVNFEIKDDNKRKIIIKANE